MAETGASQAEKGVMIPYQPTGEDMDFIRTQDYIHTDLSWNVTGLLKDMRSKGTKIYFDFSKRYRHEDVPTILKNINYGIFSFEEETEEVREPLRMGCSMGAEVLLATFGEGGSLAFDGTEFYRQPCSTGTEAGEYRRRREILWRRLYERSSSGQEHTGMYAFRREKGC